MEAAVGGGGLKSKVSRQESEHAICKDSGRQWGGLEILLRFGQPIQCDSEDEALSRMNHTAEPWKVRKHGHIHLEA